MGPRWVPVAVMMLGLLQHLAFHVTKLMAEVDPLAFSPSTSLEAVGSGVGLKQMNNIYMVHKSNLILSLLLWRTNDNQTMSEQCNKTRLIRKKKSVFLSALFS